MPGRSSKDHDLATVDRRVVEQVMGTRLDGPPLPDKNSGEKLDCSRAW